MRYMFALLVVALSLPVSAAITGSVMTSNGAPLAGARVMIHGVETPEAQRARLLSAAPEIVPLASAQTDAKGSFSLPSPKEPVVDLRIEMRGYEPFSRRVERDEDAGAIALFRREMKRGTIAAGGKPVANALVVVNYGAEYATRTDEQGRYEVPDLKRAQQLVVIHPDYAIEERAFAGPAAAGELDRTLSAGTELTGRVVAIDGTTPVQGAVISVDGWPLATSGEDGTFVVERAPAKWATIVARKDNFTAHRAGGAKQPLTLRLEKSAVVSGRVVDAKTKVPLAGATVRLGPARRLAAPGGIALLALTDARGAYSLPAPSGSYSLNVSHPAYESKFAEVAVAAGQQAVKDVAVTQLARLSGVVVDEEKRPVPAASVIAEDAGGDGMMRPPMRMMRDVAVMSGPDGRFSIRVGPEHDLRLRASKRGMPQVKGDAMRLTAGERKTSIVLTIPTGVAVTGRVLDPNGEPLAGVTVSATETPAGGERGMVRRLMMIGGPAEEEDLVRTAADGTFTLRVREGTYDFTFKREGFAQKQVRAQNITANGSHAIETRLDPAVEISGRVTRGGMAVPDVMITSFGATDAMVVTGPDGSFTIGGLTPGVTRLMLRKQTELLEDQRSVTAPARDVVFELPVGGTIIGRVVEKGTNKALTSFQAGVSTSRGGGGLMRLGPPMLRNFTSDDGSFTLEHVSPGSVTVIATAPGYTAARTTLDVEDGKTLTDIVLELDTGVRLTGKVTGANGAPLGDAEVTIQPSATGNFAWRGSVPRTTTDANGEYTLDGLDAGEETVRISHPKHVNATRAVTLKGRETRLDVQLTAGQRVTGVVVNESGMPVAEATVLASGAGDMREARTNASGTFELETLTPGRYRFMASKSGYADGVADDVDVTGGAPVRITLRTGGTIYGRVTGLTEAELASTMVMASGSGRAGGSASAPVDPQGNFRVEGAPIGTVRVTAMTGRGMTGGKTSPVQTVEVAPGSAQQVNIDFRSDTVIRGRVTRNGVPFGGAQIAFHPRQGGASASTSIDDQGNYTVNGLEPGEHNVIVRDFRIGAQHTTTYNVRGSATFDIDYKAAAVRGRVVNALSSDPISGATVELRQTSGETRIPVGTTTDPNGAFVLEHVAPGSYSVTVRGEGYASHAADLTIPDSGRDGLEFRLSRAEGVALRIVDGRDGRQVAGLAFAYDMHGRLADDSTRHGPRFGSSPENMKLSLPPGQYAVTVWAQGYAPRTTSVTSPSTVTVTVPVTPGGTIRVNSRHAERRRARLIDASGIPYPRMDIRPSTTTLLPGTTPIEHIAPGVYTLQLLNDNETVADQVQVVVREGETVDISI